MYHYYLMKVVPTLFLQTKLFPYLKNTYSIYSPKYQEYSHEY
nr:MAG TPA: hypothetical protein [Caudoviricetes sp.]